MGNPLRFKLTAGQAGDAPELLGLVDGLGAKAVLADKAYDSDKILDGLQEAGQEAIIPSKSNRLVQRELDRARCRARHLIENMFQRLKMFKRVATRYEKLDRMFMGFVIIAAIKKWLE